MKEGAALGSSEPPLTLAPKETTSGSLFAYGRSLHMSLTQYRQRPRRPDAIGGANRNYPDPTGLDRRELVFLPTYTAMLALRRIAAERGLVRPYWEAAA